MDETGAIAIPRRQRLLAFLIALVGIWPMVNQPSTAHALTMGAMLLFAWREFFYASPSARLRLGQIHQALRQGHFQRDRIVRWVDLAAVALFIVSIVAYIRS